MKILSIGYTSVNDGGPFNVVQNYIKVLEKSNINVLKKIIYIKEIFDIFFNEKKLTQYLEKFNLIHFHNIFSIRNALFAKFLYKKHIPYVISLHGNLNKWSLSQSKLKKKIFLKLFNSFIYNSQAIHVLNDFEKDEISDILDLKKLRIFKLHNCIDVLNYKIEVDSKKKFTVLFFGRLTLKKGIFKLLKIIKLFYNNNFQNIRFLFVGPKDKIITKKLFKSIEELKINKIIEFKDSVETIEEKKNIFKESDIFILPSADEADSISIKEVLSAGLPVIISKNCKFEFDSTAKDFIKIIKTDDIKEYYRAIEYFYQNTKSLKNLSYKAQSYSEKNFSLNKIENELPEIYYDCLSYSFKSKNWY